MPTKYIVPRREVVGGEQTVQHTALLPGFVLATHEEQGNVAQAVVNLLIEWVERGCVERVC